MNTRDFPTAYTLAYVVRALSANGCRILEVGCGEGHLARALLDLGHDVIAVDADPDAVVATRRRGVTAHHAEWPNLDVGSVDTVLFTRSLHHIHALPQAIDRARSILHPGGRVVVEDFTYADLDRRTIVWFARTTHLLMETGVLDQPDAWLAALSKAADPVPLWQAHHDHDLHAADDIEEALRDAFGAVQREGAAYFFRYISTAMSDEDRRRRLGSAFADLEEALAASGQIQALGQRFVAWSSE